MGWRTLVISSTAKLDYRMDYLVIRKADEIARVHLSELSLLIISSTAVSLTAYLLCELARFKVAVVFCDQKRMPDGQYVPFYGSHDTSQKIACQVNWSADNKDDMWARIIRQKIEGQKKVLLYYGKNQAASKLNTYLDQIEKGDRTNREGHAAKVYFNALFGKEFTRTDKDDFKNAALNYAYAIILSVTCQEIVSNGYITQIGVHHMNQFNQFNLASDLMEPFRPFADFIVYKLNPSEFGKKEKQILTNMLNRKIIVGKFEQYMSNAIGIYIKSLLSSLSSSDLNSVEFPEYELSVYENSCVF